MKPRLHTLVVLAVLTLSPIGLSAVRAQPVAFTHGAAESGQVKTDDTAFEFPWTENRLWVPNSEMTVTLEPNDSDLFVYEFDAVCRLAGPGSNVVEIRAWVNRLPFITAAVELEPHRTGLTLAFCPGNGFLSGIPLTAHKTWAIRLSAGSGGATFTFRLTAQVRGAFAEGTGRLQLRTVKITRYN
jgi:hypothetical protein